MGGAARQRTIFPRRWRSGRCIHIRLPSKSIGPSLDSPPLNLFLYCSGFLTVVSERFGFLIRSTAHDFDRVADHVGGAFLASGPRGISKSLGSLEEGSWRTPAVRAKASTDSGTSPQPVVFVLLTGDERSQKSPH
jgi:hypothetical protein